MSAAVLCTFRSASDGHDADWMYTGIANEKQKDVDPTVQIAKRRCLEFRRAICERPAAMEKANGDLTEVRRSKRHRKQMVSARIPGEKPCERGLSLPSAASINRDSGGMEDADWGQRVDRFAA